MSNGAFDCRGTSIATDVDAAIERVVGHFESRDLALRLDVLRALSNQAKLAFETTRVREHLAKHPVSLDLIQGVTSQSPVYKRLAEKLTVDSCSCNYDVQHNVVMTTAVRWTLGSKSNTKKRKNIMTLESQEKIAMLTTYRFERAIERKKDKNDELETLIKFTIIVAFGDNDSTPRELMHLEMACECVYPKSYYESQQQVANEGGTEQEMQAQQQQKKKEQNYNGYDQTKETETACGEDLRSFHFNNEVLADMGEWMGADDEDLDPENVISFFMALPVHEEEWLMDARVNEILFRNEMEACSDEESRSNDDNAIDVDGD